MASSEQWYNLKSGGKGQHCQREAEKSYIKRVQGEKKKEKGTGKPKPSSGSGSRERIKPHNNVAKRSASLNYHLLCPSTPRAHSSKFYDSPDHVQNVSSKVKSMELEDQRLDFQERHQTTHGNYRKGMLFKLDQNTNNWVEPVHESTGVPASGHRMMGDQFVTQPTHHPNRNREERFNRQREKDEEWRQNYFANQSHRPMEDFQCRGVVEDYRSKGVENYFSDSTHEKYRQDKDIGESGKSDLYLLSEEDYNSAMSGSSIPQSNTNNESNLPAPDSEGEPELTTDNYGDKCTRLYSNLASGTDNFGETKLQLQNQILETQEASPDHKVYVEDQYKLGTSGAEPSGGMVPDSRDDQAGADQKYPEASSTAQGKRKLVRQKSEVPKDKDSFMRKFWGKQKGTKPRIYLARLNETFTEIQNRIKKVEFGIKTYSTEEKVILLVGATGSGKSTLINALVNYLFGIEWEDRKRLKLIPDEQAQIIDQAVSQTSMITAYTIHHQPWFIVPFTLTIIDTPGFGDTGGLKRDREIVEQIREFFLTGGENGIGHIDAVGFAAQSSLPRLTPTQRYVFDSILSIFGKNIAQNIFMLLTFADGQKPQILSGLKEANMKFQKFFKFNNSALYVSGSDDGCKGEERSEGESDEDDDDNNYFNKMFWSMNTNNFEKFMAELSSVEPQSLVLTAEVLEERNVLEITMNRIHENIKSGLKKLEQLKIEQQLLEHHWSDIDKNRNFEYEVDEAVFPAVDNYPGVYSTNCRRCHRTCHEVCRSPRGYCKVMNEAYRWKCQVCLSNCGWKYHELQSFKYVKTVVKVTKTFQDLKQRYAEAAGKVLTSKELIHKCEEEFRYVQEETLVMMQKARKCIKRLNEIALKPNPLSTTDYIDLMIQEEEFMAGPGWKESVKQLEEVKKRAEAMKSVTAEGFDPFVQYQAAREYDRAGDVSQTYTTYL